MTEVASVASSAFPARPGNLVRFLIDGEAIFRRIGEAVASARHGVWLTVAFYADDFRFPDGLALFDVLDAAVARGLDVRVLFWRPNPESSGYGRTFAGTPSDRDLLRARGSRFKVRWDRAKGAFCQHQKSWMIDAGHPSETAFVGGANLTAKALLRHDVYAEITGPSATDIRHNFVQRWNDASERTAPDGNWACDPLDELPILQAMPISQGSSTVQVQRTLGPEKSILDQYKQAIDAASRTIYLENQAIPIPEVAAHLEGALQRGVEVILVVPANPEAPVYEARRDPARCGLFNALERLAAYPNFLLAGMAESSNADRRFTYVHAKVMIVDDAWATVGSCNLHTFSLTGNAEMNASIWDAGAATALRCALFRRQLNVETASLPGREAFAFFRSVARDNRRKIETVSGGLEGAAIMLLPTAYAREPDALP